MNIILILRTLWSPSVLPKAFSITE